MAIIMDGKTVAAHIRFQVKQETELLKKAGVSPTLAVIIVGDDAASKIYVKNKKKDCAEVGFISEEYALASDTTEKQLLELIKKLNSDERISGILVQLPLPKHINEEHIIQSIEPSKDVDAFHCENVGKIMIGNYNFLPCTPAGIMELLKYYDIDVCSKKCVVIGRSNIVGKPMAMLLLHSNGTVTICHSRTQNIKSISKEADILVSAVGKAGFVTADMVKDGAVVIDVGMNRDESGKLCGDVCFDEVEPKASYITPVPGGVGPMTRAILMKNTLLAAKNNCDKE